MKYALRIDAQNSKGVSLKSVLEVPIRISERSMTLISETWDRTNHPAFFLSELTDEEYADLVKETRER